jgi:acetolactate synthase-1/3 small subunit
MVVKEHIISILVNNKPDVLARIAGTFSGRGFNIENISANVTTDPEVTKIIIVTKGDTATVTKIEKQMAKIVDVLKVSHLKGKDSVNREMVLIRMKLSDENRDKVVSAAEELSCRIVDVKPNYCVLEATERKEKIDKILTLLEPLGMEDLSRSGVVAI